MSAAFDHAERPVGGPLWTGGMKILVALIVVALATVVVRMFLGLGAVTGLSDAYPWGIWKPLNVVTYTGIAAGAYAVGLLCYVFNKGEYHPFVRSAVMAGAMGYTLAGTSVVVDLGRWWNLWVVMWPPVYQLNSVLLEVAICVTLYMAVLWVECVPAVLEGWQGSKYAALRGIAAKYLPPLNKALPFIIALAILLPTMHQSSLGGLYMITPTKLHPLWHSYWLPGLFLISCWTMGAGGVVLMEILTTWIWPRRTDTAMLAKLMGVVRWGVVAYLALRFADLFLSGRFGKALAMPGQAFYFFWFGLEIAANVAVVVLFSSEKKRRNLGVLLGGALLLVFAGALYRFDTYLTGYMPQRPGAVYFPSFWEITNSVGWAAIGIAVYVVMVKRFPMLSGVVVKKDAKGNRVALAN
ncbi:MAG: NrfD/PsrC family molybdoenzyme membrane anchor subunit [Myxococcales bacterium]